jgi:hypothetical protein
MPRQVGVAMRVDGLMYRIMEMYTQIGHAIIFYTNQSIYITILESIDPWIDCRAV